VSDPTISQEPGGASTQDLDPPAARRQLLPMVSKRVDHMYGTFASLGIYCHTNPGS
jgi:hypothetical protein